MNRLAKFYVLIIVSLFAMDLFAQNKTVSDMLSSAIDYGKKNQYSEAIKVASEAVLFFTFYFFTSSLGSF